MYTKKTHDTYFTSAQDVRKKGPAVRAPLAWYMCSGWRVYTQNVGAGDAGARSRSRGMQVKEGEALARVGTSSVQDHDNFGARDVSQVHLYTYTSRVMRQHTIYRALGATRSASDFQKAIVKKEA